MSNSFYGGRDGQPFVIKETFKTVKAMIDEFKKGPGYTKVNFGEYALIETEHKNNPENGRIFKRGYDYSREDRYVSSWELDKNTNIFTEEAKTEAGGAIYVGQIIGPSGNAPHLHLLSTIQDVKDKYTEKENQIKKAGEAGETIHLGDNNAFGPNFDIKQGFGEASPSTVPNGLGNLVPGKKEDGTFNNSIKWHYCSVRDENQQETDAYIGFEIPYTVIEFEAVSVDPYYNRTDGDKNEEEQRVDFGHDPLVEGRTDTLDHPFYEKWKISIPRGVRGMSIENIGIATTTEEIGEVYAFDFIDKNAENSRDTNTGLLKIKDYPGKDEDKSGSRQIMYCTVVDYDRVAAGDKYKIYLGDYNMIIKDKVKFTTDGSLSIDYTHEDKDEWPQKVNWITDISLDADNGKFILNTNNNNIDNIDTDLTWVKSVKISDTGYLDINTTTNKDEDETHKQLQWVKDITFNDEGTIVLHYIDGTTSGDTYKNLIDWIKSINIAQDGTVTVVSNNNTEFLVNQNKLKWVSGISLSNDGTLTTNYNNGNPTPQETKLTWVDSAETNIQNIGTVNEPENALMFNMKFNNATIPTVTANLTAPNKIELNTGVLTATYNTGEIETLGTVDTLSASTAATEEEVDSNLGIGGLWFITERAIER